MAGNTVNIKLQLTSEGMDSAQKQAEAINSNLQSAGAAAKALGSTLGSMGRAGTPMPGETPTAGSPGSRRAARAPSSAAAPPPSPTVAAVTRATQPMGGIDIEEYNIARGATGAAGGTARDFADQARGLGGLVRIYATLAANVFALGAAFSALSRAMDTTNMVQGLDQLGASSGVALGGLSKRLFLATEGAVSLREAMEATVKASSAGLNTNQILQLGDVAKKASQALGLNMTDALSRLSRGISKLEPELLDELGIFVKIDDATSKYALSVGKSTSALTDFERRQAFANAVLEQGTKKFGEIKIDTNPYTKLAASFQNLLQSGLELINKVFAPIAKIFADNSALLAAAIGLIGVKILKMAIPALGEWQQQLVKSADLARKKATEINTAFGEAWVDRWENRLKLPELREGVNAATKELKKLGQPTGMGDTIESGYKSVIKGEQLTKTQLAATTLAINSKKAELESLSSVQTAQSAKQSANLQKEILQLEAIIALDRERIALATAQTKIDTAAEATPGVFSGEAQRNRLSKSASTTAIALGELAALPAQTMEKGFVDSLKNMKANLDKQGVGFVKTWVTMAVGALAAGTVAIQAFLASIMFWVAAVALVGAAIYGALKYFSATKKESELTSEAMGRLEDSTKNAAATLEKLSMAPDPLQSLSVESIQARANALKELGDSGALAVKRAFDEISKMNAGDKFLNWVSKLWGGDVQTKLSEGLAGSIKNAFKLAEDTQLTAEAKKSIESIIGTSIQSADLDKTIKKLAASGDDAKLKQVVKIIEDMGNAAAVSAAKGTELKESIKRVSTGIQEFNKSLIPTDNLSKIAQDSTVAAQKLGEALKDPVQALTAMRDVSGSIDLLSIFPADVAKNLMSYNGELTGIAQRVAQAKVQTQQYDKEVENLNKEIQRLQTTGSAGVNTQALVDQYKRQVQAIEDQKIELKAGIDADTTKIKAVFDQAVRASLIQSAELMAARLAAEMNKARTAVTGAMAGLLGDTLGGVKLRAELEKQSIAASMEVTKQSFALANKMEELKIEMERKRLQDQKLFLETKKTQFGEESLTREEKNSLEQMKTRLPELDRMDTALKGRGMGESSVQLAKSGASQDVVALQQRFEQFRVSLAGAAAQIQAIDLKTFYEEQRKIFEQSQKDLQVRIDTANTEKERANVISSIYGIENQIATNAKIQAENKAQQLADEKARNVLVQSTDEKASLYLRALTDAEKSGKKLTKEQETQLEYFRLALEESGKEVDRFDEALAARKAIKKVNDEILLISSESAQKSKELDFQSQLQKATEDLAKITLDSKKQEFDYLVNTGKVSAEYAATRIAEIANENQALTYQAQLRELLLEKRKADELAYEQERKAFVAGEDPTIIETNLQQALLRSREGYDAKRAALDAANASAIRAVEITKQQSLETAKQNELLKQQTELLNLFTGIADTLSSAFGKSGEILSKFVSALGSSVKTQMDYNTERDRLLKIESDYQSKAKSGEEITPEDIAKRTKAEKDLGDLNKQNIKNEISGYAQIAGSAKKLFKEKTVAYKLLAGVEKAMHLTKLAMEAKELFVKLGVIKTGIAAKVAGETKETTVAQGGALSRVPTYIGEIYGKTIGQLGPIAGPLVAAALAGFVVSLLGGSNKAPPGGFTAEEQQKVQGTGQYYDRTGTLRNTGGGALGDATQKSKTVENAISNMEKYDFKNLQYSNKMLKALYEIRDNTKNFATSIIKALPGINLGPTSTSSGNWLFGKTTTTTLDRGLQVVGTIGEIIDRTADIFQYTNTQYKSSGFLGIFGGGTSYGTERTMVEDEGLARNLSLIFSSAGEAIGQAAQSLGLGSVEDTLQRFRGIDLSEEFGRISLMDLDPSEMTDALNSVVSAAIDSATAEMFPYLVKFQEIGETMGDTILRLANDMNVVTLSLQELGLTLPQLAESGTTASAAMLQRVSDAEDAYKDALAASNEVRRIWDVGASGDFEWKEVIGSPEATADLTAAERELQAARQAVADANRGITTNNIELVQSLIDAAGGLENFVEQNRFFAENFLTETERLVPVQKSLTAELDRLGLSSVDTMEEFKELVLGIDFATEEGRDLYQALMDIAPAFAAVYDSTSKVLDQKEFEQKLYDQETTILQLLNNDQELLNRKRAKEIEELSKYSDAQSAVLVANQEYIYALEDENKIREKLIKQRDKEKKALEDTIKTLQSAIDALQNYKKNLLTSDLTTLTPLQQYQQNKAEFDTLSAILTSSTSTAEEKASAASKLPGVADKLLTSSRTLFASSSEYQADFDRVLAVIDSSTQFLEAQKTDAQKQLDELIASTAFLDKIEDNTKTTADLLKELEDAERKTEEKRVLAVKTAEQWQVDVLGVLKRAYDSPSVTSATELTNAASDAPTTASASVDSGSAVSSSGTLADSATSQTITDNATAPVALDPPVINVTAEVSQPVIVAINNLNTTMTDVATEIAGFRVDSAAQTEAIVYSTYDSSDKNAKTITTAVVEVESTATFTVSNSPTIDSDTVATVDR